MFCGIDDIPQNILHIHTECEDIREYFLQHC
jgi:hypothetical protein